jgi:hypothetical protein
MENFNISDIDSEIANLIQSATVSRSNDVEGCEDCEFNVVDTSILIDLIKERFGDKFGVYFD